MSNYSGGVKNRKKRALARLKEQLSTDGHPLKHYKENDKDIYEKNVKRIKKEISILEGRV